MSASEQEELWYMKDGQKVTVKIGDPVDHPPHYGGEANPYEVIKVLEAWLTPDEFIGFLKGNALKYLARHHKKGGATDLAKGLWYTEYLNKFMARKPTNG